MNKETLVINDANILFDLMSVELLESFCRQRSKWVIRPELMGEADRC